MKTILNYLPLAILAMALALLCLAAPKLNAQGTFQQALDSAIQNGAIGGGAWRATSGNVDIFSYDFLYDINTSTNALGAGLIIGGDAMREGHNAAQWNDVKGGFTINYMGNLQAIGLTNATFKVYGGNAIANPHGNSNVGVGNITFVGVAFSLRVYKTVELNLSPSWQTRVGQGVYDRNYAGIQAFLSVGGGTGSLLAENYLYQEYAWEELQPRFDE
jgi:hypothetical protein